MGSALADDMSSLCGERPLSTEWTPCVACHMYVQQEAANTLLTVFVPVFATSHVKFAMDNSVYPFVQGCMSWAKVFCAATCASLRLLQLPGPVEQVTFPHPP